MNGVTAKYPRESWRRIFAKYLRAILIILGFRYIKIKTIEYTAFVKQILITVGNSFGMNKPPARIPNILMDRFTLDGAVKILYSYRDDRTRKPLVYRSNTIDETIGRIKSRETGEYGDIDLWIYEALREYPVDGKRVAIIGSADQGYGPWYECVCLAHGGIPTTVEYNDVVFEDPRLQAIHPRELESSGLTFDAAFSFSSFEHDGLGRYGDPLNPDGDLEAMTYWKRYIKPGGLLYLTVPLGQDKVIFNIHRIYGRARFPKLIDGWELIDSIGFDEKLLDRDTKSGWCPRNDDYTLFRPATLIHPNYPEYSPVFILRNS